MDRKRDVGRVREPVQVYLAPSERRRLERLRDTLDTTKSDVLRKGLEALESQLLDPDLHPALSIVGLFHGTPPREGEPSLDVARAHDEVLADAEIDSWSSDRSGESGGRSK
ncbi:MAG: hypothetical protein F4Z72_12195 [Gemmatimonadales bacterium]|uniref:hypothetical protein n=1 Tax=Candidatus Palauibacter irciniicola TaxID=3056733 RepID=UPI001382B5D4|nr:hypothetical protein [Candidatus Palauibacter irciniicola]MYC18842.1 hypothetical protein [Gemmatimonadales bacterium]